MRVLLCLLFGHRYERVHGKEIHFAPNLKDYEMCRRCRAVRSVR